MRPALIGFVFCYMHIHVHAQSTDSLISAYMDTYDMVGMSAVVVCNDSVVFSGHYGTADRARDIPVTDSTYFRIASVSKAITAIGLMQLVEDGLIALDTNISDVFGYPIVNPHYPDAAITPAMLLSHTSSIVDGSTYEDFIGDSYDTPAPPEMRMLLEFGGDYYSADTYLNKEPGSYFFYSNLNYGIIAGLIEKVSGQRFDRYMREHVLLPLGITGSYNVYDLPDVDRLAVLYRRSGAVWQPQADNYGGVLPDSIDLSAYVPGWNGLLFAPQGGLRITALELSRLMQLFLSDGTHAGVTVLNSVTVQQMETPQWTYSPGNGNNYGGLFRSWGLGLHLLTNTADNDIIYPGSALAGHPGEAYGLVSDMYYEQTEQWGLIFMTNGIGYPYASGAHSAFYTAEEDIFDILYTAAVADCLGKTGIADPVPAASPIVFPNPADHTLHLSGLMSDPACDYTIIDTTGRICQQGTVLSTSPAIPISQLPSGTYQLALRADTQHAITTFIKK